MEAIGIKLSAFNLKINSYTLENIFQSAKVFENGGPYLDLLDVSPKEAKRDERLHKSGSLKAFRYQNEDFPLIPQTVVFLILCLCPSTLFQRPGVGGAHEPL